MSRFVCVKGGYPVQVLTASTCCRLDAGTGLRERCSWQLRCCVSCVASTTNDATTPMSLARPIEKGCSIDAGWGKKNASCTHVARPEYASPSSNLNVIAARSTSSVEIQSDYLLHCHHRVIDETNTLSLMPRRPASLVMPGMPSGNTATSTTRY
jgi:hypothetical protein